MFPFDFPVAQPEPTQPVFLHLSAAGSAESNSSAIGVCMLIENSPTPGGMHGSGLSPLKAVANYFRIVEHQEIAAAGTVSVMDPSKHGKLTSFAHATNYEYVPTPGYYGQDEATLLVEMANIKVGLKFKFRTLELV